MTFDHCSELLAKGMEVLHCQTPQMNEKELWVHLLAYNVIRLLMAQAACHAGVDPRGLSSKHTTQLRTQWLSTGLSASTDSGRGVVAWDGDRNGRVGRAWSGAG